MTPPPMTTTSTCAGRRSSLFMRVSGGDMGNSRYSVRSRQLGSSLVCRSWDVHPRIERVAQAVAEEVEARHRKRDGEARCNREPGRAGEIDLRVIEHVAEARGRRLDAVTEIAEIGFEQNGLGHVQRRRHHDRRDRIGYELAEHDPQIRRAE